MSATHDYSLRREGLDFTFQPMDATGLLAHVTSTGSGVEKGDFLVLPNGMGTTRYAVKSVNYYQDPPDRWSAIVHFAPRQVINETAAEPPEGETPNEPL